MRRALIVSLAVLTLVSCKKEEEPTFPPTIENATVSCGEASGENYPVVSEVGVSISDPDRDLINDSIIITVNGVRLEEFGDDDADDIFTWSPPASWDPPMVCAGSTFQIIVEAADAEGQVSKQKFDVEAN